MKKALLVIGDRKASKFRSARSFTSFVKHVKKEAKHNFIELKVLSYKDVLSDNIPAFMGRIITVILFFPFDYWNKYGCAGINCVVANGQTGIFIITG